MLAACRRGIYYGSGSADDDITADAVIVYGRNIHLRSVNRRKVSINARSAETGILSCIVLRIQRRAVHRQSADCSDCGIWLILLVAGKVNGKIYRRPVFNGNGIVAKQAEIGAAGGQASVSFDRHSPVGINRGVREVPFSGNLILTFQHKGKVLFLRPYSAEAAGCQLGVIQCQGVGRRIIVRRGAVTVGITQNVAGVGAGDGDAVHLYRIRLYPGCFYFSLAHRTNPVCYLMHSVLVFFGAALCRAGFPVMCAVAGPVFRPDMLVLLFVYQPEIVIFIHHLMYHYHRSSLSVYRPYCSRRFDPGQNHFRRQVCFCDIRQLRNRCLILLEIGIEQIHYGFYISIICSFYALLI